MYICMCVYIYIYIYIYLSIYILCTLPNPKPYLLPPMYWVLGTLGVSAVPDFLLSDPPQITTNDLGQRNFSSKGCTGHRASKPKPQFLSPKPLNPKPYTLNPKP